MVTKPVPPVKKIVVIEEATLISMANQSRFLKEFPFLEALKSKTVTSKRCCSGFEGAANSKKAGAVSSAKNTLIGMGSDRKKVLKKLLNTAKLRITIKQGSRIVQHTF